MKMPKTKRKVREESVQGRGRREQRKEEKGRRTIRSGRLGRRGRGLGEG